MSFDLQVTIESADGAPIEGVQITVRGGSSSPSSSTPMLTNGSGQASLGILTTPISMRAKMKGYVEQTILIDKASKDVGDKLVWNDPGSTIGILPGRESTRLSVSMPLGRMMAASTIPPKASEAEENEVENKALAIVEKKEKLLSSKQKKNKRTYFTDFPVQHAWIQQHDSSTVVYKFMEPLTPRLKVNMWAATKKALVRKVVGKTSAKGWGQIESEVTVMNPDFQGHFAYLEWTDPTEGTQQPRFLVGLWRPRSSLQFGRVQDPDFVGPSEGDGRDVVVFMSPSTEPAVGFPKDEHPYRGNYPYVATVKVEKTGEIAFPTVQQDYLALGDRYTYSDHFMAAQMLAAKRDALLIFPVQPSGHWDQMGTLQGMSKLISEALLWEHRQIPLPSTAFGVPSVPGLHPETFTQLRVYLRPPALRYVVISGFSSGMGIVKSLMEQSGTWQSGGRKRTSGDEKRQPYFSSADEFIAAWREVWDIDGDRKSLAMSGWGSWTTTCQSWLTDGRHLNQSTRKSDRIVRLYHTDWTIKHLQDAKALKGLVGLVQGRTLESKDLFYDSRGATGSFVWLSKKFLLDNKGTPGQNFPRSEGQRSGQGSVDRPAFWTAGDQHVSLMQIAIAHAAANSNLLELKSFEEPNPKQP